ncbi:MAG: apolipoprotein N-acyltransferase [Candidatus Omnitrophota bacterium]
MLRPIKSRNPQIPPSTKFIPSEVEGLGIPFGRTSPVIRDVFLCLLSAFLLVASFPKLNLEFLAWFGFVPLFLAIENKSRKRVFLFSYLAGIVFWLGIIHWLVHVTAAGMILLVLYLALYFGIFGLIFSAVRCRLYTIHLLFIPSAWVILEYMRSYFLTGFPWTLLGHSQYLNLGVIQIADLGGAWCVSFLVVLINVGIYSAIRKRPKNLLISLLCLVVALGYGYYKIYEGRKTLLRQGFVGQVKDPTSPRLRRAGEGRIKVSIIQPNIPQQLKWSEPSRDFIRTRLLELTQDAVRQNPDLIIWPESAIPDYLETQMGTDLKKGLAQIKDDNLGYLFSLAKKIKTPILLGLVSVEGNNYFNSAILVSQEGSIVKRYDKIHLVPFGEYIPLRKALPFLETVVPIGDFTAGKHYTVFPYPVKSSVLICFEDIFPEISRRFAQKGADLLINVTNDAWFSDTSAPYQHLASSIFRAVENRLPLVRSANTGISCFIDSSGKIFSWINDHEGKPTFVSGIKTEEVLLNKRYSFYLRFGDIFVFICFLFFGYTILFSLEAGKK